MTSDGIIKISPPANISGWKPVQGTAFTNLLRSNKSLSVDEKDNLVGETMAIMRKCINPDEPSEHNTGLIIGYVQSGKTLSFTGLSALARDNKYQIVIILAGTTNNLVEQSYARLKNDLDIDNNRDWKLFTTREKGFQREEIERVKSELAKWKRGSARARTILIISMKQHHHLDNLATLLKGVELKDVPTLIIDDEGDQAGMNTKALQKRESTTYTRIITLRSQFPHHSYLLYTATPQAPLLISRIDTLSPDFGAVLTPGEHYVGGQEFFIDDVDTYIEVIPTSEVPDRQDPPIEPPGSLLSALREFFVGVAIGLCEGEDQRGANRSMMIHPAVPKDEHLMFARWAKQTKDNWALILDNESHSEHLSLLNVFEGSFNALRQTYTTNLSFRDIQPNLFEAVEDTAIVELNTREKKRIPSVDWKGEYSWILVGGIGLDRGFTIEGLTVSYMLRSIGVGNADNIQQRARFFGYKRNYLGLCRIYLTTENIDAFSSYVSHEESVRSSIGRHIEEGRPLKEWKRTYFLDAQLRPTRQSVILLDMYQSRGRAGWMLPDHPYDGTEILSENREVAVQLLAAFSFTEYLESGWNDKQVVPKFSNEILLSEIIPHIGQFCYKWPNDSLQHASIMLLLDKLANDDPEMLCSFYAFSGPWSGVPAKRGLNNKTPAKIKNLFQGANAKTNYPGARALISDQTVTFHIHRYDLETFDKKRVLRDVPVLAVHVPAHLIERVWVEH